jgi:hypothetical protein
MQTETARWFDIEVCVNGGPVERHHQYTTYAAAMKWAQHIYDDTGYLGRRVVVVEWHNPENIDGVSNLRTYSRIDEEGAYEPFINAVRLNSLESGFGWDVMVSLHDEYKIKRENAFEDSDYWEVATIDTPDEASSTMRQHLWSFSNEETAARMLRRVQAAQRRARLVLAIIELEKIDAPASVVAIVRDRLGKEVVA